MIHSIFTLRYEGTCPPQTFSSRHSRTPIAKGYLPCFPLKGHISSYSLWSASCDRLSHDSFMSFFLCVMHLQVRCTVRSRETRMMLGKLDVASCPRRRRLDSIKP